MQAASDFQVRSPLIEAGFTKQDVRNLAQYWELPIWNKPAHPCLSSRIAYGVEVTEERVQRIDQGELFLRQQFRLTNCVSAWNQMNSHASKFLSPNYTN